MTEENLQELEKPSEAEEVFSSTTSKKNLSGVRGRASRTGRKGAVMTPVDFLKGKAKKEYMKNSEVKVYNMYDNKVIPYDEFKLLPVEKQVTLMTRWREEIGTNNILKDFNISRKKFYDEVLRGLGIETKPRGKNKKATEENNIISTRTARERSPVFTEHNNQDSFVIVLNGRYSGETLTSKVGKLAYIFDTGREYEVSLEIKEITT